ncbi:MAG: hypothetical protein QOF51_3340 [Chloroflexota bacterium]|nr:hypothetical protein [Chloroflexota bacterium]
MLLVRDRDGSLYGLQPLCRHQGLPLVGGTVWNGYLTCPWHQFQWDIRMGENRYPRNVYPSPEARPDLASRVAPLQTYAVRLRDGAIEVAVPPPGERAHDAGHPDPEAEQHDE